MVGVVWETKEGIAEQITVGITTVKPKVWASNAIYSGKKFVAKPTMRTTTCRSVIMAIERGLDMNVKKAFSFKLYVRTKVLAEKVKGLVRKATDCIHKGEAVDDIGALLPFHQYIERKLLNAIEDMPTFNQNSVIKYLRQHGWIINID